MFSNIGENYLRKTCPVLMKLKNIIIIVEFCRVHVVCKTSCVRNADEDKQAGEKNKEISLLYPTYAIFFHVLSWLNYL